MTTTNPLADCLDHFRARVLQDALNEATAAYWLRRAEAFENARTRPRDRPGEPPGPDASQTDRARDERLAATAQACRNRAAFIEMYPGEPEAIVWAALAEAAENTTTSTTTASSREDRSAA